MAQTASKLEALRERQARLKARIEKLENESKKQSRKDRTRLMILIGAAMLADSESHRETAQFIHAVLGRAITIPRDQQFLAAKKWL